MIINTRGTIHGKQTSKSEQQNQDKFKAESIINFQKLNKIELFERQVIKQYMTSIPYTAFLCILTIYTIFAIDIDKGFFNQDASILFSSLHVISMGIFVFQIIMMSFIEKDYFMHFYFWIDVFSTLTMLLQIIWIQNLMSSIDNIQVAVSFTKVSKASRFSKIGARSTKILKLIRLIKLFKFVQKQKQQKQQLQKIAQLQLEDEQNKDQKEQNADKQINQQINQNCSSEMIRPHVNKKQQEQIQMKWQLQSQQLRSNLKNMNKVEQKEKGTKVGEKLNYEIQKNLVIMVMGLIMVIPILNADTWFNKTADMTLSLDNYLQIIKQQNSASLQIQGLKIIQSIINVSNQSTFPVVHFQYESKQIGYYYSFDQVNSQNILPNLRVSQQIIISDLNDGNYHITLSRKQQIQITSWINIGRSVFIIFLLLFASIFFIKDLQTYALNPLQKMNSTVQKIDKDPFSALENDQDNEDEERLRLQDPLKQQLELQTNILQKFFIKITGLLALGVGQTPFNNLSQQNSQQKVNNSCIFSNCQPVKTKGIIICMQVAYFEQILQKVQLQSLTYINTIIQIFHEVVIQNGGFIFHQDQSYSFVCWKINQSQSNSVIQTQMQQKIQAQLAFMSYVKFCERISQEPKMRKFQYLNQMITDYRRCKIHIGINYGIAYCGPVGSQFKLSLKAIGQDVVVAKGLCQAAKLYKLQNLYSEKFSKLIPFIHLISRKLQHFEFLDNNFKIQQVLAYSLYINHQFRTNTRTEHTISLKQQQQNEYINEFKQRKKIKNILKIRQNLIMENSKYKSDQVMNYCKGFMKRNKNIQQWILLWKETIGFYEEGQWMLAKFGFQNLKQCCPFYEDYATQIKLRQIQFSEQPAANWRLQKPFAIYF